VWIRGLTRALLVIAICGPRAARGTVQDATTPARAESLIEDLRAKKVEVRREAAAKVRLSDRDAQRKALPVLIDLLMKEKDGQVRLTVLDTVTALGHDAASAVPALVHTLRSNYGGQGQEESHQDYRSALALAAVGKPAVEGLRGLLKERKEGVRAESIMALGRIGPEAGAAIPDLVPLLGDKSERIRREATRALGRIGTAAIAPLVAASAHEEPVIRARAVEGLGYVSAPNGEAHSAVIKCTHDANPEVRAAALKSLAKFDLPDDTVLPILAEDLRHEDESVRLAVVDWLVARRALLPRMAPELESLLTAKQDGVSRHAAFLLGKIGPDGAPRLLNGLRHEDSRIDQIAEALAQMGRPVVGLLAQAVMAPESRVRRGSALALGQIRPLPPGTARKLTVGLHDPDRAVKAAFLTAIGYLGPRAGECVPAVRELLKDESAEIRVQAIGILSQSAPRDARLLGDLTSLVDDADARVQRQSIDTIRILGPLGRKSLPLIIGKLNSPSPEVRLAAVELIGSHGQDAIEAVPALTALLDDATPKTRMIAAQTLGKIGRAAQPAFARLTSLLGAEQFEVREAATSTLASLELDAAVIRPHLARALRDDKSEVRRAASRAIQRLGPDGAIFIPDIILLAEKKENLRSAERLLRRFETRGPDERSLPELVKLLEHKQEGVRLLAIKFLGLAGRRARAAIPALERMREDPSAEVRKQAEAASKQIKNESASSQQKNNEV
jgi:HEAT repeat protein